MSTNYRQKCIVGIKIDSCDIIKEISPNVFEQQSRYDTKTGVETHKEAVLVQRGENVSEIFGETYGEYIYDVAKQLGKRFAMDCICDAEEGELFLGIQIGENEDCGRADLLQGKVSLDDLEGYVDEIWGKLPHNNHPTVDRSDIGIHFVTNVG